MPAELPLSPFPSPPHTCGGEGRGVEAGLLVPVGRSLAISGERDHLGRIRRRLADGILRLMCACLFPDPVIVSPIIRFSILSSLSSLP